MLIDFRTLCFTSYIMLRNKAFMALHFSIELPNPEVCDPTEDDGSTAV
jgi:hypothetical protein